MFIVTICITIAAIIDGLNNQDMTEPKNHLLEINPMKYNTYQKGQCTYYVLIKLKKITIKLRTHGLMQKNGLKC